VQRAAGVGDVRPFMFYQFIDFTFFFRCDILMIAFGSGIQVFPDCLDWILNTVRNSGAAMALTFSTFFSRWGPR